jgi:hypothetical protein
VIDSIVDYVGAARSLTGDYNNNGSVDAADYVVWRNALDTSTALPNEDPGISPGQVTQADYEAWRSRFGTRAGAGSVAAAVPEPSTMWMLALALLAFRRMACVRWSRLKSAPELVPYARRQPAFDPTRRGSR